MGVSRETGCKNHNLQRMHSNAILDSTLDPFLAARWIPEPISFHLFTVFVDTCSSTRFSLNSGPAHGGRASKFTQPWRLNFPTEAEVAAAGGG